MHPVPHKQTLCVGTIGQKSGTFKWQWLRCVCACVCEGERGGKVSVPLSALQLTAAPQ